MSFNFGLVRLCIQAPPLAQPVFLTSGLARRDLLSTIKKRRTHFLCRYGGLGTEKRGRYQVGRVWEAAGMVKDEDDSKERKDDSGKFVSLQPFCCLSIGGG